MASEWAPINLRDVCTKIGSGATPRGGSDVYLRQGPYALIRSQNVYNDGFHRDGLAYIGEKHASELNGVDVKRGDVLLNITGDSVARACQVDPSVLPARVNQHVAIIRPDPDRLDPRFLRYFLVAPEMQVKLLSWAGSGGTRNALTKGMIESFDVLAPEDINEQRAIAHILGTLDDKIELNRRMSETLEAMARALFKSWFVDFDPVRAKADGRWRRGQSLPGLPAHLYDLFPSRLVDSELGEIPEGWGVKAIGDVIERLPVGKKYEQKTVNTFGRVPVLDQGKSGVIGYHENEPGVFASMETPVVVFANHTCNMRLIHFPFSAIQNVLPFIGMEIDTIWSFYATYGKQSFIEYKGHWPDFIIHKIVRPEPELTREFARLMRPLLRQTWTSEHETRTLTFLRDLLLPKLIYGELRVKDAERFV